MQFSSDDPIIKFSDLFDTKFSINYDSVSISQILLFRDLKG